MPNSAKKQASKAQGNTGEKSGGTNANVPFQAPIQAPSCEPKREAHENVPSNRITILKGCKKLNSDLIEGKMYDLVWGAEPIISVKEAADAIGVSPRVMNFILHGQREIRVAEFLLFSQAVVELGDNSLAELALPENHSIYQPLDEHLSGTFEDCECDLIDDVSKARAAYACGKCTVLRRELTKAHQEIARLEKILGGR